jgi:hypothetical protein
MPSQVSGSEEANLDLCVVRGRTSEFREELSDFLEEFDEILPPIRE